MKDIIKTVDLKHFRNKTHFEFMSEMSALLAVTVIPVTKIATKIVRFAELLADENSAVIQVRKYENTDAIAQADADRDNVFRGIRNLLQGALRHFDKSVTEAAGRLKILFDTYGNVPRLDYDEETAAIDNLLQELDARQPDVEITGITSWVNELRRINGELHVLMSERYSEEAKRSQLQMKKVRVEIDAEYENIVYLLQAAAALDDNITYGKLFNEMNARITRYAAILAQEKGRRKKNGKTGDELKVEN
jgi:hypothetical protein